jgi:uncharacterized RDD family membrane protein YckC
LDNVLGLILWIIGKGIGKKASDKYTFWKDITKIYESISDRIFSALIIGLILALVWWLFVNSITYIGREFDLVFIASKIWEIAPVLIFMAFSLIVAGSVIWDLIPPNLKPPIES